MFFEKTNCKFFARLTSENCIFSQIIKKLPSLAFTKEGNSLIIMPLKAFKIIISHFIYVLH